MASAAARLSAALTVKKRLTLFWKTPNDTASTYREQSNTGQGATFRDVVVLPQSRYSIPAARGGRLGGLALIRLCT